MFFVGPYHQNWCWDNFFSWWWSKLSQLSQIWIYSLKVTLGHLLVLRILSLTHCTCLIKHCHMWLTLEKASNEALRRSELFKYFQYGKEKSLKTFVSFVLLLYNEKPRFFYRLCLLETHRLFIKQSLWFSTCK